MAPVAVDLFAGCGGLTLGLKRAGFEVRAAVELDPLAAETYAANHPEVALLVRDIRSTRPDELLAAADCRPGEVDLVAGCPPCQGFSSLRTLNGGRVVDDPRNDLLFEFARLVRAIRPQRVLMENVPGLEADPRFAAMLRSLRGAGYRLSCRVVDAWDYGVPQRRRRLVLTGGLHQDVPPALPSQARRTVRDAIGGLSAAGRSGDALHDVPANHSGRVMALVARVPHDGGSRSQLGVADRLACHERCSGFYDVYGRMAWDAPAPTITSGCVNPSKGRFLHPVADRALTLREAALLQSFPPDYHFSLRRGKYAAAEMIGNALPPLLGEAQGRALRGEG